MIIWTDIESTGLIAKEEHLLEVALVVTDDDLEERAHFTTVVKPVGVHIDDVLMEPVVREMHTKNGLIQELREGKGMRRFEVMEAIELFLAKAFEGVPDVVFDKCEFCGKKEAEHDSFNTAGIDGPIGVARVCRRDDLALSRTGRKWLAFNQTPVFKAKTATALSQTPLGGSTVGFDRGFLQEHLPKFIDMISYRNIDVTTATELAKRWNPAVHEGRPQSAEKAHRALADVRESIEGLRYYRARNFVGGVR